MSASLAVRGCFDSDLDAGGEASFAGVLTSFGRSWAPDERSSLGFRLQFDSEDWDFSGTHGFGGADPWDEISRFNLAVPYRFVASNGLIWNVTPTVGYTGESGASSSDSMHELTQALLDAFDGRRLPVTRSRGGPGSGPPAP